MAKGLLSLALSMERKAKSIESQASKLAVKTAQAILKDLTTKTPVDTSKALSNWIVSLDSPSSLTQKPYFPGKAGSTQKSSAAETLNQAKKILDGKKPGQRIFITNSLPYIRRLNDGYSKQEPAGFVERAVLIGRKTSKKINI